MLTWLNFVLEGDPLTPLEQFFNGIEQSNLSLWVRGESMLAFPAILSAHTLGMALLAGTSIGIDLRLIGLAKRVPIVALEKLYPVIWFATVLSFVSGTLLLIGYPFKAFTNPVFYVKLIFIALAVYLVVVIRKRILLHPAAAAEQAKKHGKMLAAASLVSWAVIIATGRLLAYTYKYLHVGAPNFGVE
jgi:hypothetical protein